METKVIKLRHKGETKMAQLVEFQSLDEAIRYLGAEQVFKAFKVGSLKIAQDELRGKKPREKKWLKLNLKQYNEKQISALHQFIKHIEANPSMVDDLGEP